MTNIAQIQSNARAYSDTIIVLPNVGNQISPQAEKNLMMGRVQRILNAIAQTEASDPLRLKKYGDMLAKESITMDDRTLTKIVQDIAKITI